MSSLVISGDTSGSVTLSAPAVAGTTTLTLPSTSGTVLTTAGGAALGTPSSGTLTNCTGLPLATGVSGTLAEANGGTGTNTGYYGFKNRIINGACSIFQRATNLSTNNTQGYFVDRMWGFSGLSTAFTFSQISSTGVSGFPYGMRAQRTAANTGVAGSYMGQIVESNNLQDLQGQAVSISFWARAGANYSSSASGLSVTLRTGTTADQGLNTLIAGWAGAVDQTTTVTLTTSWQKFTVTSFSVASNVQELTVFFGYTPVGTAGANDYFDITGVQLEKGSTATSFDYRPYGTELRLCQRYCVAYNSGGIYQRFSVGFNYSTTGNTSMFNLPVEMRIQPSLTTSGTASHFAINHGSDTVTACSVVPAISTAGSNSKTVNLTGTVASGLTAGGAGMLISNNGTSAYMIFSAEL